MFLTDLTIGKTARYALLPGILPRLREFMDSGFGNLAYFMALVYRAVNILPANHPYLQSGSNGNYGILDVFSEARDHIEFSTKNIDKIIVFFALIVGIIILGIQFFLLLLSFLISPATAADGNISSNIFTTPHPTEDLAFRLLDSVFGIPGLFSPNSTETPFHTALHGLFQFYSIGLLVIAAMLVAYFVFAILAETAQTGTPFGKRYNHVWVPIRLVVAIGLLVPIGSGLNSGQWITLYAAKMGSSFATNGWIKFNETLGEAAILADESVGKPNVPDLKDTAAFMMLAHACKAAFIKEKYSIGNNINAWVISEENGGSAFLLSSTSSIIDAFKASNGKIIHIRIGHKNIVYTDSIANVYPWCGDIVISITEQVDPKAKNVGSDNLMSIGYYVMLQEMWSAIPNTTGYGGPSGPENPYVEMKKAAQKMVKSYSEHNASFTPDAQLKKNIVNSAKSLMESLRDTAVTKAKEKMTADDLYTKQGWASAGIFYNRIADVNGKLTNSVMNKPQVKNYPYPMKYACEQNQQQNKDTDLKDCFKLRLAGGKDSQFTSKDNKAIAGVLSNVFDYWQTDDDYTGNIFIDVVNAVLGTQGLFDMCKNADVHPLAQLSATGKGLVDAAIRNLGFALGGGAAGLLAPYFGPALKAASSFFVTTASVGIMIGFILYYIVPFMPFLYFLFAVGGWVKGLFEAMVGVPLWALAHIRIDGQGLPGDAAVNGYFLVFEIFIRPILIIFGLLASIIIFSAMVKVLNDIFSLAVSNLSGFDTDSTGGACGAGGPGNSDTGSIEYFRGPIDEFFFTIVYVIVVYMIGMSCFKLIDMIPNSILRWMGAGVSTFNDQAGEPAEGLISKMAIGGSIMGGKLQEAGSGFKGAAGGTVAALQGQFSPPKS